MCCWHPHQNLVDCIMLGLMTRLSILFQLLRLLYLSTVLFWLPIAYNQSKKKSTLNSHWKDWHWSWSFSWTRLSDWTTTKLIIDWNQEVWCLQLCPPFSRLLWLFGSFMVSYKFSDSIYISVKNATEILIAIILIMKITLVSVNIFILILPSQEHRISFNLCVCLLQRLSTTFY